MRKEEGGREKREKGGWSEMSEWVEGGGREGKGRRGGVGRRGREGKGKRGGEGGTREEGENGWVEFQCCPLLAAPLSQLWWGILPQLFGELDAISLQFQTSQSV